MLMPAFWFFLLLLMPFLPPPQDTPPNIVLIFADDLGYGDLSTYGHPTIHTPRLDQMAHEGIKLTAFYAAPGCSPSRAALLTGRYAIRTTIAHVLGPEEQRGLPQAEITLAEALKGVGYRTGAIGKWHLGAIDGHLPTQHGFDSYYGLLYSNDMIPPWVNTEKPLELWRDNAPIEHLKDQRDLTERYTAEAVRFIDTAGEEPFFLYFAHSMPHVPLATTDQFAGTSAGGPYGDVIEMMDWSTGQVLDALETRGLTDNTLVIFTSDNGPWMYMPERMFGEGKVKPWDAGSAGPLRMAKHSNYEGGPRVPFIAYWPGNIPGGQVSAEMASTMDLLPTLLTLAGAEVPQDRIIDGLDLWPFLQGEAASPRQELFYIYPDRMAAVRDTTWKLHLTRPDPDAEPVPELYHMGRDPYERFDVAADHPEVVQRLRARMEAMATETGAAL